jgi:UDP-glucose 4-epimerase
MSAPGLAPIGESMRILVTGGAGYVGGFAARHLLDAGHDVVIVDDLSLGHRQSVPAERLVVGNASDRARITRLLDEHRIEAVMHFAASAYVGESVTDPAKYWRNNVANTLELLLAMRDCEVGRIVFSSTCALYGERAEMPLTEETPQDPGSPYAFTKFAIERMIRDFARAYGLGHVLLRYFNAAGAQADGRHGEDHSPETHLIPILLQALLGQRDCVEVYGDDYPTPDGTCIRDYVHVEDLARAHELAVRACPEPGAAPDGLVFNVGTGTGSSVLEVIQTVERVTGKKVPYRVVGRRPGDAPRLVASSDRLRKELGWRPEQAALEEIVHTAWAWHSSHPHGYEG